MNRRDFIGKSTLGAFVVACGGVALSAKDIEGKPLQGQTITGAWLDEALRYTDPDHLVEEQIVAAVDEVYKCGGTPDIIYICVPPEHPMFDQAWWGNAATGRAELWRLRNRYSVGEEWTSDYPIGFLEVTERSGGPMPTDEQLRYKYRHVIGLK